MEKLKRLQTSPHHICNLVPRLSKYGFSHLDFFEIEVPKHLFSDILSFVSINKTKDQRMKHFICYVIPRTQF